MKFNDADSSLSEIEEVCEESELKRVKIEKMEPEMIMAGMGSRKRKGNKEELSADITIALYEAAFGRVGGDEFEQRRGSS